MSIREYGVRQKKLVQSRNRRYFARMRQDRVAVYMLERVRFLETHRVNIYLTPIDLRFINEI